MKELLDFAKTMFFKEQSTRKALQALFMSLVVCAVVYFFLCLEFSMKNGQVQLVATHMNLYIRNLMAASFVIIFFVIWFILHIVTVKELDDAYSEIREKLIGIWSVEYDIEHQENHQFIPLDYRGSAVTCKIAINSTRKLEIIFNIESNNPIWESETAPVSAAAIKYDAGTQYMLFYYFKGRRKIKKEIQEWILPDENFSTSDGVGIEFIGITLFNYTLGAEGNIDKLQGSWFDLNGNITRMLTFVEYVNEMRRQGEEPQKMELSDVDSLYKSVKLGTTGGSVTYKRLV